MHWNSHLFFGAATPETAPSHPYYPLDAAIEGYVPNHTPVLELLLSASGACFLLLSTTFAFIRYVRPTLRTADRIAILWFVLCMYL
jgi:cholestenol delta-isomerase